MYLHGGNYLIRERQFSGFVTFGMDPAPDLDTSD
jgi:hypothetical protein